MYIYLTNTIHHNIIDMKLKTSHYLNVCFFSKFNIDHYTSLFSQHQKEVFDNLIRVVGSEMDIRIRQNVFLIMDKLYNKVNTDLTRVASGSLAEGLDLPGSDIDVMLVINDVQVIQKIQHMNRIPYSADGR